MNHTHNPENVHNVCVIDLYDLGFHSDSTASEELDSFCEFYVFDYTKDWTL